MGGNSGCLAKMDGANTGNWAANVRGNGAKCGGNSMMQKSENSKRDLGQNTLKKRIQIN